MISQLDAGDIASCYITYEARLSSLLCSGCVDCWARWYCGTWRGTRQFVISADILTTSVVVISHQMALCSRRRPTTQPSSSGIPTLAPCYSNFGHSFCGFVLSLWHVV